VVQLDTVHGQQNVIVVMLDKIKERWSKSIDCMQDVGRWTAHECRKNVGQRNGTGLHFPTRKKSTIIVKKKYTIKSINFHMLQ
jgi:hypothetical protein